MTVTKSNFAFRIDRWDNNGNTIEHVAWIEDFDVALAAFRCMPALARRVHYVAAGCPCH
jgi:hypothetical protein